MQNLKNFLLIAAWGLPATVGAQPGETPVAPQVAQHGRPTAPHLSLTDAIAEADRMAFANRGAGAAADIARAAARRPLQGLLPSARVEAGAIRTTDPIGAFGTLLRQRRVTAEAFAPARLNTPDAIDNLQGAAILEIPLVNGDALLGRRAASRAADAATARAEWTTLSTRLSVVRGYFGAILAAEKQQTLARALIAGEAMTAQIEQLLRQGLVTRADLLQMQVRTRDVEAQRLAADAAASTAREQLSLLLGRSDAARALRADELPAVLPTDATVRAMAGNTGVSSDTNAGSDRMRTSSARTVRGETREDMRASRLDVEAARFDVQRAGSTLLPRLNGVARYDWNAPSGLYTGRPSWTVGVMASWSLFGGGSELADIDGGQARLAAARTAEAATMATARLEQETAVRQLRVTLAQLDLAALSMTQSQEAHRLVQRRYVGGLATVAEVLAAEASETASALQHAAARYAVIEAVALYRLALGVDPGAIAAQLDPSPEH